MTSQGVTIEKGIEYARHDGVALLGDLYAPEAPGKYPAIVAVHGGGWQQGSREAYGYWGNYLAARGYVLFTVDYRLSKPGAPTYPQAVHDVRAAVQYLRGGAVANVDPSRLALVGDSAGGHLAALVALAGDAPAFAAGYPNDVHAAQSTKVKAMIGAYGVYDLARQWKSDLPLRPRDMITEKFLGAALSENRRLYFEASPESYAQKDNNATTFFLTYGTEDDVVDRVSQSEGFLVALKQAGYFARTAVIQGFGHFWMSDPIEEEGSASGALAPRLLRFLADKL